MMKSEIGREGPTTGKRLAATSGFTLMEVLVALFVLALGLLGLASLQLSAGRSSMKSAQTTRAVLVAQARMETLKSAPFALLDESSAADTACQQSVQIKNGSGTAVNFYQVDCTFVRTDIDSDGEDDLSEMTVAVTYNSEPQPVTVRLISSRSRV